MISIVFAVPYPDMHQLVLDVFASHPLRNRLKEDIKVIQTEQVEAKVLEGSVIVARGLSYLKIIRQHPRIPCVEIVIHASDIMAALLRCKQTAGPRRIALMGFFANHPDLEMMRSFLGCEVAHYIHDSSDSLRRQFERAVEDGCDAFVGGYSLCALAGKRGYPSSLITSSREEIRRALDEAIRTYSILQHNEISKIALENTKEPILYLDDARRISYVNPAARRLLGELALDAAAESRPIGEVLPFLESRLAAPNGRLPAFENEIHDANGAVLTVSCTPIRVGNASAGGVIAFDTVKRIRDREYSLRQKLSEKGLRARYSFQDIIHRSPLMARVVEKAGKCALASSNLLLVGETGTGKELFAQSIHNYSARKDGPFVAINCAALPEHLIESELFGYSEGAFTGARKGGKLGLIETAHGGTLFLDEVAELPLAVQGKLLRVLQEREVRRVGDDRTVTVDVRVISASNLPLSSHAAQGRFRRDLLYRLDILRLHIPPLRERRDDVLELFWHNFRQYNRNPEGAGIALSPSARDLLLSHPFEGNVRELRNIAERLAVLHDGGPVEAETMRDCLNQEDFETAPGPVPALPAVEPAAVGEAEAIREALRRTEYNRTLAARQLGMDRTTLWRKMRKHGIGNWDKAARAGDGGNE